MFCVIFKRGSDVYRRSRTGRSRDRSTKPHERIHIKRVASDERGFCWSQSGCLREERVRAIEFLCTRRGGEAKAPPLWEEQKKRQKELAQKRERELKEQKKKAQEEERLRELAEADGRRMVEVNDSYFNRYVPDVAETLPAFKAPSAVEVPKK